MQENRVDECRALAKRIRLAVVRMTHQAKSSHVGTCLSVADILAALYGSYLRVDPATWSSPDRDRLVVSKGHSASAVYAVLAERGFFPKDLLSTFYQDGTYLAGHVTHTNVPGVEASTGSLGHGLALGCGMALAGKVDSKRYRVVVLLSDGECDEGSIWEAALFAPFHRLDNLTVIVDYNKLQSFGEVRQVLDLEPFSAKWSAFGWAVREVDGHDMQQLCGLLSEAPLKPGVPTCVIAHTVKGKGVSFMENNLLWHYRPPSESELAQALSELEALQ